MSSFSHLSASHNSNNGNPKRHWRAPAWCDSAIWEAARRFAGSRRPPVHQVRSGQVKSRTNLPPQLRTLMRGWLRYHRERRDVHQGPVPHPAGIRGLRKQTQQPWAGLRHRPGDYVVTGKDPVPLDLVAGCAVIRQKDDAVDRVLDKAVAYEGIVHSDDAIVRANGYRDGALRVPAGNRVGRVRGNAAEHGGRAEERR